MLDRWVEGYPSTLYTPPLDDMGTNDDNDNDDDGANDDDANDDDDDDDTEGSKDKKGEPEAASKASRAGNNNVSLRALRRSATVVPVESCSMLFGWLSNLLDDNFGEGDGERGE